MTGTRRLGMGVAALAVAVILGAMYLALPAGWPGRVVSCHGGQGGTLVALTAEQCMAIGDALKIDGPGLSPPNGSGKVTAFEATHEIAGLGLPPPADVELRDLPGELVRRVPQLEGHRYFVFRDDILLVDPKSNRVVIKVDVGRAVMP